MQSKTCNEEDYGIMTNRVYIVSQMVHIVFSISTIISVAVLGKSFLRIRVHKNVKAIVVTMVFCIVLHATTFVIFEVHHLWRMFVMNPTTCRYHNGAYCACIRIIIHCFALSLSMLQLGLCIERTIATIFSNTYEKKGGLFGTVYCILSVFLALMASVAIDYPSREESFVSCLNNSRYNRERVDTTNYVLTAANVVTIFWLIIVHERNKKYLNKLDLGLSNRYQIQENVSSTRLTIAVGCTQLLFFSIHLAINMVRRRFFYTLDALYYRTLESIGYLLTYYSLILPLVMYFSIKRDVQNKITSLQSNISRTSTKGTEGTNIYFNMYKNQW